MSSSTELGCTLSHLSPLANKAFVLERIHNAYYVSALISTNVREERKLLVKKHIVPASMCTA